MFFLIISIPYPPIPSARTGQRTPDTPKGVSVSVRSGTFELSVSGHVRNVSGTTQQEVQP